MTCGVSISYSPRALVSLVLSTFGLPNNGIRIMVRLCGRAGARSSVRSCYRLWGSMLPMNGWNIGFIRENIHLPNTLKFWVEMWCLVLLWPWCIGLICASNSLKMIIEEKKIMRVIKWQPKNILIWKRIQQFSFKYQMTCSSFTPSKINIL